MDLKKGFFNKIKYSATEKTLQSEIISKKKKKIPPSLMKIKRVKEKLLIFWDYPNDLPKKKQKTQKSRKHDDEKNFILIFPTIGWKKEI